MWPWARGLLSAWAPESACGLSHEHSLLLPTSLPISCLRCTSQGKSRIKASANHWPLISTSRYFQRCSACRAGERAWLSRQTARFSHSARPPQSLLNPYCPCLISRQDFTWLPKNKDHFRLVQAIMRNPSGGFLNSENNWVFCVLNSKSTTKPPHSVAPNYLCSPSVCSAWCYQCPS